MKQGHQVLIGLFMAVLFSGIVLGSLYISMLEGGYEIGKVPSVVVINPTPEGRIGYTNTPYDIKFTNSPTYLQASATQYVEEISPSPSFPSTTKCPSPQEWKQITIKPGDKLENIAQKHNIKLEKLMTANCLAATTILPGSVLFVPNQKPTKSATKIPTSTPSPPEILCGPPANWVPYVVAPGDTLHRLSRALGVSIGTLNFANCLSHSAIIYVGQILYVPFIPVNQAPPQPLPPISPPYWPTPVETYIPPNQVEPAFKNSLDYTNSYQFE